MTLLRVDPCCQSQKGPITGEPRILLTPEQSSPMGVRGQGSYLVPGSILTNTLGAGLLGDTVAFQHDLVWGAEAAFRGVVPTGARIALTVPGAATLTVVVHQGWWAKHGCRQRRKLSGRLTLAGGEQKHSQLQAADHRTDLLGERWLLSTDFNFPHLHPE